MVPDKIKKKFSLTCGKLKEIETQKNRKVCYDDGQEKKFSRKFLVDPVILSNNYPISDRNKTQQITFTLSK